MKLPFFLHRWRTVCVRYQLHSIRNCELNIVFPIRRRRSFHLNISCELPTLCVLGRRRRARAPNIESYAPSQTWWGWGGFPWRHSMLHVSFALTTTLSIFCFIPLHWCRARVCACTCRWATSFAWTITNSLQLMLCWYQQVNRTVCVTLVSEWPNPFLCQIVAFHLGICRPLFSLKFWRIETSELDGETNLKAKTCLVETADMGQQHDLLAQFNGEIVCEPPNNLLNKFDGTLIWQNQRYALDNDKVLLRGCVLRNTQWCYGVVVFAGRDTKLMQNSGKTKFKSTSIDRFLNYIIIGVSDPYWSIVSHEAWPMNYL